MASQARAAAYLEAQKKTKNAELQVEWDAVDTYFKNKLWNEMSSKLVTLVKHPALQNEKVLREMYDYFIEAVELRLNPFGLVTIMDVITNQISDKKAALALLVSIQEKVKICDEAVRYVKLLRGHIFLEKLSDIASTKLIIEDLRDEMEAEGPVTEVHAKYYILAADYYRRCGNHNEFYRTGLLFLGCAQDELPKEKWPEMALMLSISALLGDKVFNVGELLLHPVLQSLNGTKNDWLIELLTAYHAGNVDQFIALKPKWSVIPDLRNSELKLRQKISMVALMELTFQSIGKERCLTFDDIARVARVPPKDVELLVMKAFAMDLVRGQIDQVTGIVNMKWVKPRTLNHHQIGNMSMTINSWLSSVNDMEKNMESGVLEIITHDN